MHIAFLTPSLDAGGYERVVVNYANEAVRTGHRVTVLCGRDGGELEEILAAHVERVVLGARARTWPLRLRRFLRSEEPDALYVGFRAYSSLAIMTRLASGVPTKVIASQHGFESRRRALTAITGRVISRADLLVTNAPDVADSESDALGIPRHRYVVLDNPVIDGASRPLPRERTPPLPPQEELRITVAGRLAPDKRVDLALRILAAVRSRRPARMTVLGDGPERAALSALAADLGVAEHVRFAGFVPRPDRHLDATDVFLHTAEREGFGNVVVEALHHGVPVVCTSCSGPPYIIEHGRYGVDIGAADDPATVQRGARAVLDIAEGRLAFPGMRERALQFSIGRATQDLLDAV